MRIVGGKWKGRKLFELSGQSVVAELRPTTDRARETIFNILKHGVSFDFDGAIVLDLFCGTGALGLEALSRGAKHACFVDCEKTSLNVVNKNKVLLKAHEKVTVLRKDATKLNLNSGPNYNLVFLDPPYGKSLGELALRVALARKWISKDAVVIWEERSVIFPPRELNVIKSKYIGNSCINFLTRCD